MLNRHFDHITLCSPSGALLDENSLDRAILALNGYNLPIVEQMNTRARQQRFAGSDFERLSAVNMAIGMQQSGLILTTRGGYGISRILPQLDLARTSSNLNRYQHLLCGHSDITGLQLALMQTGAQPSSLLHGPMACFDFGSVDGVHPTTRRAFEQAAFQGHVEVEWTGAGAVNGRWEGKVWGGNLSIICSLLATPYFPDITGGILILEDVNEATYKVERMMLQLAQAGVLNKQKVIVIGNFGDQKQTSHDVDYDLSFVVDYLRHNYGLQILEGFPFGHVTPKVCWFQGGHGSLETQTQNGNQIFSLKQSVLVN